MTDRSILYTIRAALQGGYVAVAREVQLLSTYAGVLTGAASAETALERLDGTGVGAAINTFTGSFTAATANIDTWFGGRQQTRLRCTNEGVIFPLTFTLPGTTDLTTAFDQLAVAGLPEVIRLVIEYTGSPSFFLSVLPLASPNPQISGTTSIPIRSGVGATLEITRTSGTISDYVFQAIGGIGDTTGGTANAVKLINPREAVWDASTNGPLPSAGVVQGNSYRVVNAPGDGSGRFSQRMRSGDRVVVDAETFTSWSALPAQWYVQPLEDVIRGSALDEEFLTYTELSPQSDRNTVLRGANYADEAGEIRLKLYATRGDYSAADLNTTGDIDEYTDATGQTAFLGIRLTGNQAALASTLPDLYIYSEDSGGNFTRIANLDADFTFEGDFGAESDYLSREALVYNANDTWRIYRGTVLDRFTNQELDISFINLDADLQARVNGTHGNGNVDEERLSAVESKIAALFPLTSDVTDLTEWSDVFNPEATVSSVEITNGYSLIADYRGAGTRYESAGVTYDDTGSNVVRYTGLGNSTFRTFSFKVTGPANQVLLWIVDGSEVIPYIDMTSGGVYRVNNYTPTTTEDQVVSERPVFNTRTGGDEILTRGTGNVSTYTLSNFPANATQTSRYLNFNIDIFVNGSDTQAGDLVIANLPATNAAANQVVLTKDVYLGPLYANRTVRVEIGYTLRVSGGDLLVDFTLVSAPSDVTVRINDVATVLSYTAPAAVARVDNFVTLQDGGGDYTFAGENELLLTFHPFAANSLTNVVPAAINSSGVITELNDRTTPLPASFATVEIPDQAALTGFEFRTFAPEHFLVHSDLSHLLLQRTTRWCYGLALLRTVTELAVTSALDFPQGIVLTSPDASRWSLAIDDAGMLVTTKLP